MRAYMLVFILFILVTVLSSCSTKKNRFTPRNKYYKNYYGVQPILIQDVTDTDYYHSNPIK